MTKILRISVNGSERSIELDDDGFIVDPTHWCKEFAEALAEEEGIPKLTDEHWRVINYLHDFFVKNQTCPPVRMLAKNVGMDVKRIYQLFPTGPAKGACRLAGAPKPTGCV